MILPQHHLQHLEDIVPKNNIFNDNNLYICLEY